MQSVFDFEIVSLISGDSLVNFLTGSTNEKKLKTVIGRKTVMKLVIME